MSIDKKLIASNWVRYYEINGADADQALLESSIFALDDLVMDDPILAFEIICLICRKTNDTKILANLAAGPLESLLAHRGKKIIHLVEDESKKCKEFKKLLSGVWQNLMPDSIWARVQAASK